MRSDSGRRSEPEGAEIVYMRDNVSVHPTQYMAERISGRLKLIKQGDLLLLVIFVLIFVLLVGNLVFSLLYFMIFVEFVVGLDSIQRTRH